MKVQHLTLGGNSVTRDTAEIAPVTRQYFRAAKVAYTSTKIELPAVPATVKITATEQGAAFDLLYQGAPIVVNFCCFSAHQKEEIISLVWRVSDGLPYGAPKTPAADIFLYSVVLLPFAPPEWMAIAGEIELYLFEELFSAWKEKQN